MRLLFWLFATGSVFAQNNSVWVANLLDANEMYIYNAFLEEYESNGQVLGDSLSCGIAVGDLNGDGSLDVAVANNGACYLYHNNGSGQFTRTSIFGYGLPIGKSIALADMDQNGTLDVIMATINGQESGLNQIFLNDGSGIISVADQLFGDGESRSIAVADLNGDGYPDVYEALQSNDGNRVWFNNKKGAVVDSQQSLGLGSSFSVALGDVNGDGHLDAVTANDSLPNKIWINDGTGTFTAGSSLGLATNALAVALGDVDGDNDLDILFGNDGPIFNIPGQLFLNDGNGNFQLSSQLFPIVRTISLHIVDVDNDGDKDIVFGNIGADSIWLNNGSGQFTAWIDGLGLSYSSSIFAGPFQTDRKKHASDWGEEKSVLDLVAFERLLDANDDHQRGR